MSALGRLLDVRLAGAAESAYLYANGMGVPAGEKNEQVNFSEKYIAWYMFHGMTKDDIVKGKVRASQVGEGFDPKEAKEENELTPYFIGDRLCRTSESVRLRLRSPSTSVSVKINGEPLCV